VAFFDQVHIIVKRIPQGRVATYGQIARLLDQPHAARTVGWAMRGVSEGSGVPWHRVVNASGRISLRDPDGAQEQRRRLEAEGIVFDGDHIDLGRFGWEGLTHPEVQRLLRQ
jgi:methylated-DNA-protein-cysteine methyltransferase-like protein